MPAFNCPRCRVVLTAADGPFSRFDLTCSNCAAIIVGQIFPRMFARDADQLPQKAAEGAAVCYTHDSRAAVAACDHCGRGLCALCDLPVGGRHVCPVCLEKLDRDGQIATLKNHEVMHDYVAMALAILPLIVWPFTLLTAPFALFYIARHWSSPKCSMIPRTRIRYYIAGLFALAQCAGWGWLFFNLFLKATE